MKTKVEENTVLNIFEESESSDITNTLVLSFTTLCERKKY